MKKIWKNLLTIYLKICIINLVERTWSLSSAGRASALQAGGHRFEPYSDHHVFYGPVVQLVRTLACHARGRRFEPVPGRQVQLVRTLACHARGRRFEPVPGRHFFITYLIFASIAQLVEQGTENPCVSGSIPLRGTNTPSV